jgi:predicted acyl esterase
VVQWQVAELIYLEDAGYWRNEMAWPPESTNERVLYFGENGRLSDSAPLDNGSDSYDYRPSVGLMTGRRGRGNITPWAMPLDQRLDEAYSLVYSSEPMTYKIEILGEVEALLYFSSTADTAYFHVKLCDVAPDGSSKLISDGGLLSSHRNSHEDPEPIEPGKVYDLRCRLKHCAYSLHPGHRLRVMVASADFQNAWPTGRPARNTLYRGGAYASRITAPVAGRASLEAPQFAESPHALPALSTVAAPEYAIRFDLVRDTVTTEFVSPPSIPPSGVIRSLFTVSNANPARAVVHSEVTYTAAHPTLNVHLDASCQTSSDENSDTHMSELEITVNGNRHFQKSWTESAPRRFC